MPSSQDFSGHGTFLCNLSISLEKGFVNIGVHFKVYKIDNGSEQFGKGSS